MNPFIKYPSIKILDTESFKNVLDNDDVWIINYRMMGWNKYIISKLIQGISPSIAELKMTQLPKPKSPEKTSSPSLFMPRNPLPHRSVPILPRKYEKCQCA